VVVVLACGCATAFEDRIEEPLSAEELVADLEAAERAERAKLAHGAPGRPVPAAPRAPTSSTSFATAVATLVPYGPRSFEAVRSLYEIGQRYPAADEARYLAAAASLDLAAYALFREDRESLATLAQIRGLPASENHAALFTAIGTELRAVRSPTYAAAARGLAQGAELLQLGPESARGTALATQLLQQSAPAAHIASLFYIDATRRGVAAFVRDGSGLSALAALADDPCARGCEGSPLAPAPEATRRAATAVQHAYARVVAGLASSEADPFGTLARPVYEEARAALDRVPLPERNGPRGRTASRVLVELGLAELKMSRLPQIEIVEGRVSTDAAPTGANAVQTVRYVARWPAKVTPYEPFTQAARLMRAGTGRGAEAAAPPVAIAVDDELEAHVFARVVLSLMAVGFEDIRLRRREGDGWRETRLRPVPGGRLDEEAARGRARVEVYGPFDYDGAERTFRRFAAAGRPPSAQLVLFALIASRALHRALDAVRVAWPEQDADILLVLPQQVP
jgi:hypothetical protein